MPLIIGKCSRRPLNDLPKNNSDHLGPWISCVTLPFKIKNLTPQSTSDLLRFTFECVRTRDLMPIIFSDNTCPLISPACTLSPRVSLNSLQKQFSCPAWTTPPPPMRAILFTLFPSLSHPQLLWRRNGQTDLPLSSLHILYFLLICLLRLSPADKTTTV